MRRYGEIAQSLREDIGNGRYPVGSKLPTEEQLVESFGASRHAVREALRLLTEDGLISRRPRAGSLVIGQSPRVHFTQRVASMQEVLNYPPTTERRPVSTGYVSADHELASLLRCAVGTSWFRLETMRYASGSPFPLCLTHVYVRPEFAGITRHKRHASIPFADQIADLYDVHADSTDFEISATLVPPAYARVLEVRAGSAALTTIRRYADSDGSVFEVSVAVHPAERYTFNFHLQRERSAAGKRRT